MQDWLIELCGGASFMPHGHCYQWRPDLVWLHGGSDALIALAYFSIPVALVSFVRKRPDLPYPGLFVMFGAFIVACGLTHMMEIWAIWHGTYYLTGAVKALTAVISVATAVVLWRVMPQALQLAGPEQLRKLNESLEVRVAERTADLEAANGRLQAEIAERRAAEAKVIDLNRQLERRVGELKSLLEVLPVGVAIADDADCREVRMNRVYARMLGLDDSVGTLGAAMNTAAHGVSLSHDDRPLAEEERPMRVCARENRPVLGFEKKIRRDDGSELEVIVNAVPLSGERGAATGCVAVFQDVTDLRAAARERVEVERKIQETQKLESLGVLAGGIAHDFNNILTAIMGNAALAAMQHKQSGETGGFLKQIERGCTRAAELCTQMLAYSGRGRFVMEHIDLNALIQDTTHLIGISLGKTCVLRLNLAERLPAIHVDPSQIRQIVMNLVINASEAIGTRSGVVAVSTGVARIDRDYRSTLWHAEELSLGDYVFLEVCDNGCGMEAATMERVFEPFFTTKFTGRGLGLAAVLGIIRSHGGGLKVYSEPGKGTTFKVFLPALPAGQDATTDPDTGAGAPPPGAGETVLVVDDEETVRSVSARMLEEFGYRVETACDGREAVEKFSREPGRYALVLLDLTMPHLDGEETFRQLRHLRPGVRVVLMSGFSEHDAVTRFSGKGLAGFVQKPFSAKALAEAVQSGRLAG